MTKNIIDEKKSPISTSTKEKTPVKTKVKEEIKPLENKVKLPESLFNVSKINEQAIFDTIMFERNSRRQGTHAVKTRATVSGTGKKPWKQKGTGRARAGTLRSPVFVGGGRAFGPQPDRNYNIKINKKVRKLAFLSALTLLAKEKLVLIYDDFKIVEPKTKTLVSELEKAKINKRRHILLVSDDVNVFKSAANLKNVCVVKLNSITVENLVWTDALVMSSKDLKNLEGMVK
ncbi:MAG: 50S ribosomal protein L4 [Metamycoplasmataceae bacterium]